MKLYRVFLLFFFSGILFVGVVSDTSADFERDGPYEAVADAYRFGGNENRLHVSLYARASSTVWGKNGYLEIELEVHNKWFYRRIRTSVDGYAFYWASNNLQFEENSADASAYASGLRTNGTSCSAYAYDDVLVMPDPDPPPPTYPEPAGISPVDPDDTPSPGETHEYRLVTHEAYSSVDWYVKAPWDTSERGSHIETDSGDSTSFEATFSYTFPSGAMHTGGFLITAVITRLADLSQYEETYTATVSLE